MSEFGMTEWVVAGILFLLTAAVLIRGYLVFRFHRRMKHAKKIFHHHRERLEAKFFDAAANSGKPRGLKWVDCDFSDAVCHARDRGDGTLLALVAVKICFEAIEDGLMEDVEAVNDVRVATAVFHFEDDRWVTRGRALFNLDPFEAIDRLHEVIQKAND